MFNLFFSFIFYYDYDYYFIATMECLRNGKLIHSSISFSDEPQLLRTHSISI